jgi:type III restriction enzyme
VEKRIPFRFDSELEYQREAIDSVLDLFRGADKLDASAVYQEHLLRRSSAWAMDRARNREIVDRNRLFHNLLDIQRRNKLPTDERLHSMQFTVEMETGTGKTYVYLRTIIELYRKYGFTKFMIVVPSIAVRKGVEKSVELLREHFMTLYDGLDLRDHLILYDVGGIRKIRRFVEENDLCVAVMNIQAFNKERNKLRQVNEDGSSLWEEMRSIRPIVLIDEPQKLEGAAGKSASLAALELLDPLFVLRYSATHKCKYHPIYRLDSYEAYRRQLVKRIEVKTVHAAIPKDVPYIRYVKFTEDLTAKIEIFHAARGAPIRRRQFDILSGADLFELSGGLPQYRGMRMLEDPHKLRKLLIDTDGGCIELAVGECHSGPDDEHDFLRIQIRIAIRSALRKQLDMLRRGRRLKVLTLFFIDAVRQVRDRSAPDGRGIVLRMFDEEYAAVIREEPYSRLWEEFPEWFGEDKLEPRLVREGYFALDKDRRAVEVEGWSNVSDERELSRKAQEEIERGIELILEKKDELLSFATPLSFIFSHSALREGWDNPNIFTLCSLKRGGTDIAKKQEIGRGLRLPVDIDGIRCFDEEANVLTVIASDEYERFAAALQRDFNEQWGYGSDEQGGGEQRIPIRSGDEMEETIHGAGTTNRLAGKSRIRERRTVKIDSEAFIEQCIEELNHMLPSDVGGMHTGYTVESATASFDEERKLVLETAAFDEANADVLALHVPLRLKSELEIVNYLMFHTMLPRLAVIRILSGIERKELLGKTDALDAAVRLINRRLQPFMGRR